MQWSFSKSPVEVGAYLFATLSIALGLWTFFPLSEFSSSETWRASHDTRDSRNNLEFVPSKDRLKIERYEKTDGEFYGFSRRVTLTPGDYQIRYNMRSFKNQHMWVDLIDEETGRTVFKSSVIKGKWTDEFYFSPKGKKHINRSFYRHDLEISEKQNLLMRVVAYNDGKVDVRNAKIIKLRNPLWFLLALAGFIGLLSMRRRGLGYTDVWRRGVAISRIPLPLRKVCITVVVILGLSSAFVLISEYGNSDKYWFHVHDMNFDVMNNALKINDGEPSTYYHHPGISLQYLHALFLRLYKAIGVNHFDKFSDVYGHDDPVIFFPELYNSGERTSLILCMIMACLVAGIAFLLTRRWLSIPLAYGLTLFSAGVLLQSMIERSELGAILGGVAATFFLLLGFRMANFFTLVFVGLSGFFFGLGGLAKIQIAPAALVILAAVAIYSWRKNPVTKYWQSLILNIAFGLSVIFCVYWTRIQFDLSWEPKLYWAFVAINLALFVGLFVPRLIRSSYGNFGSSLLAWSAGFLLAFPFLYSEIYLTSFHYRKFVFELIFQPGAANSAMVAGATIWDNLEQAWAFYRHFSLVPYSYAVLLLLPFASRRSWVIFSVAFVFVLVFAILSGLRYFAYQYTVFTDVAFVIVLVVLALDSAKRFSQLPQFRLAVVAAALTIGVFTESERALKVYKTYGQNQLTYSTTGFMTPRTEYEKIMKEKYGSVAASVIRIFEDPSLNGTSKGIDVHNHQYIVDQYDMARAKVKAEAKR